MKTMHTSHYRSAGGIDIHRASFHLDPGPALDELRKDLDSLPGVLLGSACEFPGRYSRWDIGFVAPPLRFSGRGRQMACEALNARGEVLLQILSTLLPADADCVLTRRDERYCVYEVLPPEPVLYEEARTRRRSLFTLLRRIIACFASQEDAFLGLYGAFGYALAFQLEDLQRKQQVEAGKDELVLYLPDRLLVVDHKREVSQQHLYDFSCEGPAGILSTRGRSRHIDSTAHRYRARHGADEATTCDHAPGAYAATVQRAREYMARGDLFEVVPSQTFARNCPALPSVLYGRLREQNPAPYAALMNLGYGEFLIAASPEMYVRVEGSRVETCPISGTITRGGDALEDAEQIRTLLNSAKDEAELSMCTDVDRSDKSRVCVPGSVRVIGRRQIELYSRLIHTVDHVEGRLKPGLDALDAFLSHAWAVTVTGAPKRAAMQFIEDHERSPRRWYGGAIGCLHFNGDLNTGLSIRSIHVEDGMARVRVGATLLYDSDPLMEEAETRLKASALLAVLHEDTPMQPGNSKPESGAGRGLRVLMVDHQDSFVHTLAGMLAAGGAEVRTVRPGLLATSLQQGKPDLLVLSPGPGRPIDHGLAGSIALCLEAGIPLFGVCLGLQGIVEYFGGSLATLPQPMHGKASRLSGMRGPLFAGLPEGLQVGRYHSLVADRVPPCLDVCGHSEDGAVMALEHRTLPVWALQFHPESILSSSAGAGQKLLANLLARVSAESYREAACRRA